MDTRIIYIIFFILISISCHAQWLCPWENRIPVEVSETSGNALTDHQVRIDLTYQTGMQADFADIRFTTNDGTTLLNYWVEDFVASTSAIVWVKMPTLPANGNSQIYLYYSNTTANSASNGVNTFVFFDDFEYWSGWNNYGSGVVEQDTSTFPGNAVLAKITQCDPNGGYKEIGTTLSEFRLISREIRLNEEGSSCSWNRYGLEDENYNGYNIRRNADSGANNQKFGFERRTGGGASNGVEGNLNHPYEIWYRTELTRCSANTNNITASLYDDNKVSIGSQTGTDITHNSFDRITIRGGRPYYVDHMAVAKFTCSDPSYAFGTLEEDLPTAVCQNITTNLDNNGKVSIQVDDIDNGSSDECGIDTKVLSQSDFDCEDIGENKVELIITDLHGNTAICNAAVTVVDVTPPSITCPDDIIIEANTTDCSAIVNWTTPAMSDNCSVSTSESDFNLGATFPLGVTTVTYQLKDGSGNENNCSFTITVKNSVTAGTCNIVHDLCQLNEGAVSVKANGGTAPYQVTWNPNVGSSSTSTINSNGGQLTITNIPGGNTINISVRDANGCPAN